MSLLRCYPKNAEGQRREDLPVLEIETNDYRPEDFDFEATEIDDLINHASELLGAQWTNYQQNYGSVFGFDVVLATAESSDTEALWLLIPDANCTWEYIVWLVMACEYADTEDTTNVAELAWYICDEGNVKSACQRMDFYEPGDSFAALEDKDTFEFNSKQYIVG